ncbi:MAG: translocation/assembly module TamB domain-containing protein [Desulfovibrionales bacterium]
MNFRRPLVVIGSILGGVILVVVLLLAAGLGLVQTEWGRAKITDMAEQATAESDSFRLQLEGLGRGLPWRIRFERFTLSDSEGVWLRGEDIAVDIDLWDVLRGTYHFPLIRAEQLDWQRMPLTERPEEPEADDVEEPFSFPQLPSLVVGELDIHRILISEQLAGQPLTLTAQGELLADEVLSRARLAIEVPEGGEQGRFQELTVRLDYSGPTASGEQGRLEGLIDIVEEPEGLVHTLLGLSTEDLLRIRLEGVGPVASWSGEYHLALGDKVSARGSLGLEHGEPLRVSLDGEATGDPEFLPGVVVDALGSSAAFESAALIRNDVVDIEQVRISAEQTRFTAQGLIDLSDERLALTYGLEQGTIVQTFLPKGFEIREMERLTGQLRGPFEALELSMETAAQRFSGAGLSGKGIAVAMDAALSDVMSSDGRGLSLGTRATFQELTLPGDGKPLQDAVLSFTVATRDFNEFTLSKGDLRATGVQGELEGTLQTRDLDIRAGLRLDLTDPALIAAYTGGRAGAKLSARSTVSGTLRGPDLDAAIQGTIVPSGLPGQVGSLMGDGVQVQADFGFTGEQLRIRQATANARHVELRLQGGLDLSQRMMDLEAEATLDSLAPQEIPVSLTRGDLQVQALVQGGFDDFSLNGTIRAEELEIQGEPVLDPVLALNGHGLPSDPGFDVRLTGSVREVPVSAQASLAIANRVLRVDRAVARAEGLLARADLEMELEKFLLDGTVRLDGDFSGLQRFFERPVDGLAAIRFDLTKSGQGVQIVTFEGTGENLSVDEVRAGQLNVKGSIRDLRTSPTGGFEAEIQNGRMGEDLVLASLYADVDGNLENFGVTLEGSGALRHPFGFRTRGRVSVNPQGVAVILPEFQGEYQGRPVSLAQPANVKKTPERFSFDSLLNVDTGSIGLSGSVGTAAVDIQGQARDLPLSLLNLIRPMPVEGLIQGDLHITGPPGDPVLRAEYTVDMALPTEITGGESLQAVVKGTTSIEEVLNTELVMEGFDETPSRARVTVPTGFSLQPFAFDLQPSAPLSGTAEGVLNLQTLSAFALLQNQALSGRTAFDVNFGGTVQTPSVDGRITLANGRYENFSTATLVRDIQATITAQGRRLVLEELRARDGNSGTLRGTGAVSLLPEEQYPFELSFRTDSFHILRKVDLTAQASGTVGISGDTSGMAITGKVALDPLEYQVSGKSAPAIAELNVRETNIPPSEQDEEKTDEEKTGASIDQERYPVSLDLSVTFPARFFVRGRGMDAEFQGRLTVGGTAQDPVVRGGLSVLRGTFDFLDRTFELVEGNITFDGATPPSPLLNVRAEWESRDITVMVLLSGRAGEPNITLESDPSLPQDEIMARVLFGRSAAELSPLQALRLANAVRQLSGEGGEGFDIVGTFREAFDLDELEFGMGEEGPTVGAGKYLQENVYLQFEKGLGKGRDRVSVEIELHENLSVESEIGSDSQGGVGIFFKQNY